MGLSQMGTLVYLAIKAQGQPISGLHIFISVDLDIAHGWLAKKMGHGQKINDSTCASGGYLHLLHLVV